jgi:hypothetical protein
MYAPTIATHFFRLFDTGLHGFVRYIGNKTTTEILALYQLSYRPYDLTGFEPATSRLQVGVTVIYPHDVLGSSLIAWDFAVR